MATKKIKRLPVVLSDYIVVQTAIADATDKARELISSGYEPWGSPVLTDTRWTQVFILKELKEIKKVNGNTDKEH